jgi:hypothetical protein
MALPLLGLAQAIPCAELGSRFAPDVPCFRFLFWFHASPPTRLDARFARSFNADLPIDKGEQRPGNVLLNTRDAAGILCIHCSLLFVHALDKEDDGMLRNCHSISNLWLAGFHTYPRTQVIIAAVSLAAYGAEREARLGRTKEAKEDADAMAQNITYAKNYAPTRLYFGLGAGVFDDP